MGSGTAGSEQTNKNAQTTGSTTTQPWLPTQPALGGIINQVNGQIPNAQITSSEQGALGGLESNAAAGNPFALGINSLVGSAINGTATPDRTGVVNNAYDTYQSQMQPFVNADTNPYSNPAFTNAANVMSNDITDRVKSAYAGAGYSPATVGDFSQQLGRGITQGLAPTWNQAYQQNQDRKLGATNSLYGAGNTTGGMLAGLDQTALGNRFTGVGQAGTALSASNQPYTQQLGIDALRRGIPTGALGALNSLIVPMAALGQQGTSLGNGVSTSDTTKNAGLMDYLKLLGGGSNSPVAGGANAASALLGLL